MRIKNKFLENWREFEASNKNKNTKINDGDAYLYQFGDIKLNVLIEWNGMSLIGEISFLLNFMSDAKALGHGLYSVVRNAEFVQNVNKILEISHNKQEQLLMLIHSGNSSKNQQLLASLLFCYKNSLDFEAFDDNGLNCIHYLAKSGNDKLFDILVSCIGDDTNSKNNIKILKKMLNMPAKSVYKHPPTHYAVEGGSLQMLKKFLNLASLKNGKIVDLTNCTKDGSNVFLWATYRKQYSMLKYIVDNNKRFGWEIDVRKEDYYGQNAIIFASTMSFLRILKLLVNTNLFDLNHVGGRDKGNAIIYCSNTFKGYDSKNEINCDNFKILKYLLGLKDKNKINLNGFDVNGNNFIHILCIKEKYEFIKYVFNSNKYILKIDNKILLAKNEKQNYNVLFIACYYHYLSICKYLLLSLSNNKHGISFDVNEIEEKNNDSLLHTCVKGNNDGKSIKKNYVQCLILILKHKNLSKDTLNLKNKENNLWSDYLDNQTRDELKGLGLL